MKFHACLNSLLLLLLVAASQALAQSPIPTVAPQALVLQEGQNLLQYKYLVVSRWIIDQNDGAAKAALLAETKQKLAQDGVAPKALENDSSLMVRFQPETYDVCTAVHESHSTETLTRESSSTSSFSSREWASLGGLGSLLPALASAVDPSALMDLSGQASDQYSSHEKIVSVFLKKDQECIQRTRYLRYVAQLEPDLLVSSGDALLNLYIKALHDHASALISQIDRLYGILSQIGQNRSLLIGPVSPSQYATYNSSSSSSTLNSNGSASSYGVNYAFDYDLLQSLFVSVNENPLDIELDPYFTKDQLVAFCTQYGIELEQELQGVASKVQSYLKIFGRNDEQSALLRNEFETKLIPAIGRILSNPETQEASGLQIFIEHEPLVLVTLPTLQSVSEVAYAY